MEPMKVSSGSRDYMGLVDIAVDLAGKSEGFKRSMPEGTLSALCVLSRQKLIFEGVNYLIDFTQIVFVDIDL